MKMFNNHRGELVLYVTVEDNCIVIKDTTYEKHDDFYWIPIYQYRADPSHWRRHLLEKNWGTLELIDEIESQIGVNNYGEVKVCEYGILG